MNLPGVWGTENFLGLVLLSIYLVWSLSQKTVGWGAMALWAYCLLSGLLGFMWPRPEFLGLQAAVAQTTSQAFTLALVLPAFALSLPKRAVAPALSCMGLVGAFDVVITGVHGWGFMNASSADTAFIAAVFPLIPIIAMPFALGLILYVGGRTALLILAAQCLGYALAKRRPKYLLLPLTMAGLFFVFAKHSVTLDENRLLHWKLYWDWWKTSAPPLTGAGLGTFEALGPVIDLWGKNPSGEALLQMHSDWLQIGFELGALGLLLSVWVYLSAIYCVRSAPGRVATWFGLGMFAMTYYPLRFFFPALFVCLALRDAIDYTPKKEPYHG